MIDFLFLMLMFFATLAVTKNSTQDTEVNLVEIKPETKLSTSTPLHIVHINVTPEGKYTWMTDLGSHPMNNVQQIAAELNLQYEKGILPQDKDKTHVLLKIDKDARWDPILKALFAIRDQGFQARPVYLPEENS